MQDDATVVQQRDRLAQVFDEVELMAREQQVATLARVLRDDVGQEAHGERVEAGEGLVQHEQVGRVHHRRRQLHALRHAPRQRRDLVALALGEVELLEQGARASAALVAVEPVEARDPHEEVEHAHVAVEAALLRHVAPHATVVVGDRAVAPRQGAGVGCEHAEQDAHQRGLPGPVGTEEPDDPPGRDVEVDRVEHGAVAESLRDATRRQLCLHGWPRWSRVDSLARAGTPSGYPGPVS